MAYEVTDRRPIAARRLGVMHAAAGRLGAMGVSANAISLCGMVFATLAGAALVGTRYVEPNTARVLWLLAAVGVQGRLLCNLLDGMVAIRSGTASPVGELYNEVPDRYSDAVILVCLGYAAGGMPALGWAAALAAVLTAYVRAVGRGLGLPSDFRGPMAKQQRMFLVTLLALAGLAVPWLVIDYHLAAWTAGVIALGALVTTLRRLAGIATSLRKAPPPAPVAAAPVEPASAVPAGNPEGQ